MEVVVVGVRCGGGCGCRRGSVAVDIGVDVGPMVVMGCGFCGGGAPVVAVAFVLANRVVDLGFVVDWHAGVLMVAIGLVGV